MKFELKRIGPWAFIKVAFFVNLIVGFFFGLFEAAYMQIIFATLGDIPPFDSLGMDMQGISSAVFWVFMPIFSSVFGAVFMTFFELIIIGIYNVVARLLGGMEFDLSESVVMTPHGTPPTMYAQTPPPQPSSTPPPPPPPPTPASAPPPPPPESLRPDAPTPPTNHPSWRPIHQVDERRENTDTPEEPPEQV